MDFYVCCHFYFGVHNIVLFLLKYVYLETLVTSQGTQPSTFTQVVLKYFHLLLPLRPRHHFLLLTRLK